MWGLSWAVLVSRVATDVAALVGLGYACLVRFVGITLAAVGASRRRLLLLGDVLAGRRASARVEPALQIAFEDADAAL